MEGERERQREKGRELENSRIRLRVIIESSSACEKIETQVESDSQVAVCDPKSTLGLEINLGEGIPLIGG